MKTSRARAASSQCSDFRKIYRPFSPTATLKCIGQPLFRNQYARDYAAMMDLDPNVISWRCVPEAISNDSGSKNPCWWHVDFAVETVTEALLVEVWQTSTGGPSWLAGVAKRMGYRLQSVSLSDVDQCMFHNAKDLMRYIGFEVPLGDRIRVLAALDEMGSLTLAEALCVCRESRPMYSIASLILTGILHVDLSEALLGPDTLVRRAGK